jgi:hypothetical protein
VDSIFGVVNFPAVNPQHEEELNPQREPLLHAIARDVHFWIPLGVLMAGLILLHELR